MISETRCHYRYFSDSSCNSDGPFYSVIFGKGALDYAVACGVHIVDVASIDFTKLEVTPL